MKKLLASSLVAIAAIAILATSFSVVGAQSDTSFAQKIAEKLGISETEAQTALDEIREEKHEAMQEKAEERLSNLVEEGTITEEQKEEILAKKDEVKEELENLSPKERRERMKELKEEFKEWAEEEGIEIPFKMGPNGRGFRKGGVGQFKDCPCEE